MAATLVVSMVGMAAPAAADPAEDAQILVENLPAAGAALAEGLQETADTLVETQSAVETSAALGDALVASGSAAVAGTEQFGALGFGFELMNDAAQRGAEPYLGLVDGTSDPEDVFNPEDLATLADNGPAALETAQPSAIGALAAALGGEFSMASAEGITAFGEGTTVLTQDTNYATLIPVVGLPLVIALIAGQEYMVQAEEGAAPLFDALAPATQPIIDVLEDM